MDRQNDLTLEALIAREKDSSQGLDHFRNDRTPPDGFVLIGIPRRNELVARLLRSIHVQPASERRDMDDLFATFDSWQRIWGAPHPLHVKMDPYSAMWQDGINCDRCGATITALNAPQPLYGVCSRCTIEMSEEENGGH